MKAPDNKYGSSRSACGAIAKYVIFSGVVKLLNVLAFSKRKELNFTDHRFARPYFFSASCPPVEIVQPEIALCNVT